MPHTPHSTRFFRGLAAQAAGLWLVLCAAACSQEANDYPAGPDVPPNAPGENAPSVTLTLDVAVGESSMPNVDSRSYPTADDGTFEGPASAYEKLKTLRVIIVRPDGTVEHNRYVRFDMATGHVMHDDLQFKVVSNEKKTIYLFGNEALAGYDFYNRVEQGAPFPTEEIAAIQLTANTALPIVDNQFGSTRTYIPMSEAFEVFVDRPASTADIFRTCSLFITRSLVKFSFSVNNTIPFGKGVKLCGIKISGLANSCYYLPRNTVYDPPKYSPSANPMGGRYITSYDMPPAFDTKAVLFPIMPSVDLTEVKETELAYYMYVPESKTTAGYTVSLLFEGDDEMSAIAGTQTLELRNIARNTFVKVNINLHGWDFGARVDVQPYTGVNLNPSFGL